MLGVRGDLSGKGSWSRSSTCRRGGAATGVPLASRQQTPSTEGQLAGSWSAASSSTSVSSPSWRITVSIAGTASSSSRQAGVATWPPAQTCPR